MFLRIKFCFLLFAFAWLVPTWAGQTTQDRCDFSAYRPLIFDHALYNAALEKAEPKYPAAGKAVRASGNVNVRILVNRAGRVVRACALDGHPLLRSASERTALKWLFKKNFGLTNPLRKKYIQSVIVFIFKLDT
jgi:Gram-negative bacterial TonB protein C-terminal